MYKFSIGFITGVQVGFELIDGDQTDDPYTTGGIVIDLLIIRILITSHSPSPI